MSEVVVSAENRGVVKQRLKKNHEILQLFLLKFSILKRFLQKECLISPISHFCLKSHLIVDSATDKDDVIYARL